MLVAGVAVAAGEAGEGGRGGEKTLNASQSRTRSVISV